MITKIYRVKGTFVMGDEYHKFTKEYKATCEADVEQKIYERFGSKHGITRNQISIKEIEEIAPEDVEDPIVKEILQARVGVIMEDQQRLNNLLNEINAYRQQAELIQQQIELIQASIAEVDALSNTLDDIEGKEAVEAFVPVGAGSFIKGELKSTDEIIVSIGSGLAVKKDADGAREILAGQKEDLKDSLDKMLANLQQCSDIMGSLQAQAEQIAAAAQGNITQM